MKKILVLTLAAVMLISLAACGGKQEPTQPSQGNNPSQGSAPAQPSDSANTNAPAQTDDTEGASDSRANGDGSYRFLYGWDNHEVTLYTPDYAVSEGSGVYSPDYVQQENVFEGMALTFEGEDWYCQARDWQSNTVNFIEHLAQYYFTGKVEDTELKDYSQTAADLGFKWLGKPVQIIVSTYQTGAGDYTYTFVGVEYDNKTAPDGGKGLVGLDFFSDCELTGDQLAYIAGHIFGVDSGVEGDPFEEGGAAPVASIDASAIIGSWLDPESTWGTCFTFNADGSGARSATVTGETKPFTYQVEGDKIMLKYSDGLEDELTAEPLGNALNLTDIFGNVTKYEASEEPEPTVNAGLTPADLAGTWLDSDGDGYTLSEDGTGSYKEGDESWELTFSILNGDQVSIRYDDGDRKTFNVKIDGNDLIFDDTWVMTRQ